MVALGFNVIDPVIASKTEFLTFAIIMPSESNKIQVVQMYNLWFGRL